MGFHILIDEKQIENRWQAESFDDGDFSKNWFCTVEKEIGIYKIFSLQDDPDFFFDTRFPVIATASVNNPPDNFINGAKRFLQKGGTIIIEMPSSIWSEILEEDGNAEVFNKELSNAVIAKVEGINLLDGIDEEILPPPFSSFLKETPINTRLMRIPLNCQSEVLLTIDGAPGIIRKKSGSGFIVFLLFDMGMLLVSLKQGVPSGKTTALKKKSGRIPFVVETQDLTAHKSLLQSPHPYADILEKYFFAILECASSFPRLWYFPFQYDGVFLMTHDDEKRGYKKSKYMIEEEISRGYCSTFFVICDSKVKERWQEAKNYVESGMLDIQWHWNRFPDNIKVFSPQEQISYYESIPNVRLHACRLHFLNWGRNYTRPFQIMESLGVKLDTSYGPNQGKGYLFGTGLPYHPIAVDGSSFSLWELPFHTQEDWSGVDLAFIEKLLQQSRESYHSVVVPLFHPHKTALGKGRELWLGSFAAAEKQNHWITTFTKFGVFYENRCKIEININSNGKVFSSIDNKSNFFSEEPALRFFEEIPRNIPLSSEASVRGVKDVGREYKLIKLSDIDSVSKERTKV